MQKHIAAGVATAVVAPSLAPVALLYYTGGVIKHKLTEPAALSLAAGDDPSSWQLFLSGFAYGAGYWAAWYLWQRFSGR